MLAEQLLREGRPDEALKELEAAVRKNPADAKLRVFLFQILCVQGAWDRALTQLNVAADMNPGNLLMAQVCRPAIACEAFRAEIFAGRRAPLVMGEPDPWLGLMVRALEVDASGEDAAAQELRAGAFDAAPAIGGTIDDQPFEWLADADTRLGPIAELIIDGRYFWAPFSRMREIRIEPPTDLRDLIWTPATIRWRNGGESVALMPARYPGSEKHPDPAMRLGRRTEFADRPSGAAIGLGQRLFATDAGEHAMLTVRSIAFAPMDSDAPPPEPERG